MTWHGPTWPWLRPDPLVLASGSATRLALLAAAGLPLEVIKPVVDERAVEEPMRKSGLCAADRALLLARAKTVAVANQNPGRIVVGADQTLDATGHPGVKARDKGEAKAMLMTLSGRTHRLHAGWCIAVDGMVVCEGVMSAVLRARAFDGAFIDAYIEKAGDAVLQSVGSYQIEGLGQHLFDAIHGEHSTILGLPMPPVLACLRRKGILAS
ncbi:MAG: Maf family protein [Beijerinckiaceae bacterium]